MSVTPSGYFMNQIKLFFLLPIERTDGKERENLLRRLYLESPIITEDAIELLKSFVTMLG